MPDNNTANTEPTTQTQGGSDPNGQTPNPQSQTTGGTSKTPIDSLPPDIQEYISRLRSEAEEANRLKKAEAKAKQQAEEARLAEQGEFKKLAEQLNARVKELEPIATSHSTLALQLGSQIDAEIKDWPAELKAFDPGKDRPVEERMAWMQKSRPLLEKLQQQARGSQRGNSPNPAPTGQGNSREEMDKRNRIALPKQRNYGL